jgi:hypothetical protein
MNIEETVIIQYAKDKNKVTEPYVFDVKVTTSLIISKSEIVGNSYLPKNQHLFG